MASDSRFQIEPELLQPKPRRVQFRDAPSTEFGFVCLSLFFAPFILVGIYLLFSTSNSTLVILFGRTTTGRVSSYEEATDDHAPSIKYQYRVGSRNYIGEDEDRRIEKSPSHATVLVRFGPWLPAVNSKVVLPAVSLWPEYLFSSNWVFTLIWNAVVFPAVGIFRWALAASKRLYTHGDIAVGTIIDKVAEQDEGLRYILCYEFIPHSDPPAILLPRQDRETVNKIEWDAVHVGDLMSVLHQPQHPEYSVLYRFGIYKVIHGS
jgi:hypothetical protein